MTHNRVVCRESSYAGEIGASRERFCADFIRRKQAVFTRLQHEIFAQVEARNEKVSCHKGCSACCILYIEADIQECEAIVYYLYHNPAPLDIFLKQYEDWRSNMRALGDPFARCEEIVHQRGEVNISVADQSMLLKTMSLYHEQGITCPFLNQGACSIHDVRPYVCLNHYVTTPSEWCREKDWYGPDFAHRPRIYMTSLDDIHGVEFYHSDLARPVIGFMPTTVYRILTEGIRYVSELTGLVDLKLESES